MNFIDETFDVVVVGAGHAGCEAALSSARLGLKTAILTISMDSIADMPCNPNIGGTGKGHLVREIDALGGEMALNIDKTFIQSRMLNTSKGPAVHSLRVQADKKMYHTEMKKVLENEKNISLIQAEVKEILVENEEIKGVLTTSNEIFPSKTVIICTGTYLKSMILMGENCYESGPNNWKCSAFLSDSLKKLNIPLRRFKTGTPARVHKDSIDYSKMEIQKGDIEIIPFSFMNEGKDVGNHKENCFLTYTTLETKKIIEENLHRSPMYAGIVKGVGPRYCPSIEDKIVRFNEKNEHQVFIEPEGLDTCEMYVQGVSSTLPLEVQKRMYKTILGLENVKIMRPAYGIEYDCIDPTILKATLEHKDIKNLFFAGQINGTSGYEEAASQGIIAGINSAMNILGKEPFVLTRSDAYIGVLIDDLITKGTEEPYRMMTSRTEYRLSLRQDNADLRLTEKSFKIGLASKERYERCLNKKNLIESEIKRLKEIIITPKENINEILENLGSMKIKTAVSLYDLIKRPELDYEMLKVLDLERPVLEKEIKLQVQTMIKYEGYIEKQSHQIEAFKKLENKKLVGIDYENLSGLRLEAIQKLSKLRPETVGQASRISGVSPADINVLLIHLESQRRKNG
ncbi:MAG: tRNA uridine-5-carboxymethylaminomethyl(34) synthesis enzyme MnmG [Peptoniphilaceae bacterium]|uniref:tRNA uridine-5-carboxymethylaminomethyl(34) synthesis enzyme MnmG n=1 Tax=Parvimonas sp. TaxID=1944660 RepID=UPI0025F1069F|nr:tRNA uridine-5-carboxymethylaminomethyl(34) synthesis enzyme MnmG [Parvimonas sp.]MCI5997059.1 tRNA uridine-5-carboxymethylaminomethyl(34) synthesis enzyme MnmG [Parvimonas sp.]MDD7764140.1 tRNA uridine-5-carboxymethylaminomethyl(34) synthesis enzyme MnmG [Peptoniphilaceae bacterium]MDY3050746.1 tRNA uridine-5-carboxymethylaminomethyl(34) synthesis enzyme MnmG [Parvimonas sp.]